MTSTSGMRRPPPSIGYVLPALLSGSVIVSMVLSLPTDRGAGAEFRQHEFFGRAAFDGEGPIIRYFQAPDGEQPYVLARGANGNIVYLAGSRRNHRGRTGRDRPVRPRAAPIDRPVCAVRADAP